MTKKDWLSTLKVGDEVGISNRYGIHFGNISGETKLYWKVAHQKFRKYNGVEAGSDIWTHTSLVEPTDQLKAEVQEHADRAQAIYSLHHMDTKTIPTKVLVEVVELLQRNHQGASV